MLNLYICYVVSIAEYILLSVTWCQLPDNGSKAETCNSKLAVQYIIVELCVCWCCQNFVKLLNTTIRTEGCGNDGTVERHLKLDKMEEGGYKAREVRFQVLDRQSVQTTDSM